jgi:hypothetical protein
MRRPTRSVGNWDMGRSSVPGMSCAKRAGRARYHFREIAEVGRPD